MRIYNILLLLISLSVLVSCNSDQDELKVVENETTTNITAQSKSCGLPRYVKELFLVGHKKKDWYIYKYVVAGQDLTAIVGECNLDNVISIYRNGNYIETEGATKCDPANPYIHNSGKWRFNNDAEKISLVSPNLTTVFDILDLTPNHLVLEFYDENLKAIAQFWMKPTYLRK